MEAGIGSRDHISSAQQEAGWGGGAEKRVGGREQ